ncbi:dicarboxylate:amino acid:cation symporter DAACS family protein [Chroococcidiopsis cubana SAG 39.79]|uniref:Dicarboxylate:amino acid:cation symporter DAACS family protein n=1 Tax=Chroococcidiopsis cubana SAG 39.79 TaxID=388085 RepID=A0AB37UM40_9CYAN|nr:dicarboxylate/amino acid:cation symporter [Chroococcidiopsis cubana]PSB64662.1 sodium:dicarboxylate symporter [Chroococcidiopsis cubana CCALA 043]RUT12418.1 dicarboxylate:amino acid:cation symporter DAACS family protein [Chroococcidiopsis cubana SAG 39.79]
MKISTLILAALGLGIAFGILLIYGFPEAIAFLDYYLLSPLGEAFLRLIQFVVVPIVFSSLILGLTRIQNATQVGRYALKLISSYAVTSAIAVGLGIFLAIVLKPGVGVTGFQIAEVTQVTQKQSLIEWLVSLIPVNPLEALSTGNLLQTIFSAALIGVGLQLIGDKATNFVSLIESVYFIFEKILSLILYTAPIGVFALISSAIATQGLELIVKLFVYVIGLCIGSIIMIGFYALVLFILKAKPIHFFQCFFPTLSLAFGTASSNAALPIALQNAQENYGMREDIASFAIPLGTALKRDGSAILQGFNALFIAQLYQIPLTPSLMLAIALSTFLVSFSTAGVPGAGIIMMTTVLSAAGLPVEGVALVAGVDRLTDGLKTVLNVVSNTVNAVILSHWESSSVEPTTEH